MIVNKVKHAVEVASGMFSNKHSEHSRHYEGARSYAKRKSMRSLCTSSKKERSKAKRLLRKQFVKSSSAVVAASPAHLKEVKKVRSGKSCGRRVVLSNYLKTSIKNWKGQLVRIQKKHDNIVVQHAISLNEGDEKFTSYLESKMKNCVRSYSVVARSINYAEEMLSELPKVKRRKYKKSETIAYREFFKWLTNTIRDGSSPGVLLSTKKYTRKVYVSPEQRAKNKSETSLWNESILTKKDRKEYSVNLVSIDDALLKRKEFCGRLRNPTPIPKDVKYKAYGKVLSSSRKFKKKKVNLTSQDKSTEKLIRKQEAKDARLLGSARKKERRLNHISKQKLAESRRVDKKIAYLLSVKRAA